MTSTTALIDDLSGDFPKTTAGTEWQLLSDAVMGGVSSGRMTQETVAGRKAIRMRGDVSLENNGGFLQMALDLAPGGGTVDASGFTGIAVEVWGNGEDYGLHLRSADIQRPWQSYRQGFRANAEWGQVRLPFSGFVPHRIDVPLDLRRLRRLGLVAIGRAFTADLAVGGVRFY